MTVNAFHPLYMQTHEPKFMDDLRTHEARRAAAETLSKHVTKVRKTKPTHGTVFGIERREFHTYAKAGMPKTRSQMMSEIVAKKRISNKNYGTALPGSVNIPKVIPK